MKGECGLCTHHVIIMAFSTWSTLALIWPYFVVSVPSANGADAGTRFGDIESIRAELVDNLTAGYQSKIPPNYEEDTPVTSLVQMFLISVDSVSEASMDYSISMFLRQTWNDSRLRYPVQPNLRSLELDVRTMDKIWVPDVYIVNEKKASVHQVTVPNKLMHIYPDGTVYYSLRITGTFTCNMDLRKYPLDTQTCNVIMESYGYSTRNLLLRWNDEPVEISDTLALPQFDIEHDKIQPYTCDRVYNKIKYTCIGVNLTIVRRYGYYITQMYIPSVLIVILSWVSFWLNIDAVPARISLGLLTVLTMTTQSSGARASLPRVSYVKAIDIWMAACLIFVFAALIEFAYVNVLSRVEQRRKGESVYGIKKEEEEDENGDAPPKEPEGKRRRVFFKEAARREKARTVDKVSRILFPTIFVIFNIIYWCVYLFWEPNDKIV